MELLAEAFLSRKGIVAYRGKGMRKEGVRELTEHESILAVLLRVADDHLPPTSMSPQAWAALRMLHRLRGNHANYLPNPCAEEYSVPSHIDVARVVTSKVDAFGLLTGPLSSDSSDFLYSDSRFSPGICEMALPLHPDPKPIGQIRKKRSGKRETARFFERSVATEKTPFGFPVNVPKLSAYDALLPLQTNPPEFEWSDHQSEASTSAQSTGWFSLVDTLCNESEAGFFARDPASLRTAALWERSSAPSDYLGTAHFPALKDYEQLYLRTVDTFFLSKSQSAITPPIPESSVVDCVLKALVGVPSWLFVEDSSGRLKPRQELRLSGMSPEPVSAVVCAFLSSAAHWLSLQSAVAALSDPSAGLVEKSFAAALESFLRFYHGLVLAQDTRQSILQLEYGTMQVRKQLELLKCVAEGIRSEGLKSETLLNYLKVCATAYDGDFEQAELLRNLLCEACTSFTRFLHLSLYFGDFEPSVSHFFLRENQEVLEGVLDAATFETMVTLSAPSPDSFLHEVYGSVQKCVRNVMLLRLLPQEMQGYYRCASGAWRKHPPEIAIRLTDADLKSYSAALIEFHSEQMEALIDLDRAWMIEMEVKKQKALEAKLARLETYREQQRAAQAAELQLRVDRQQRQTNFYNAITQQIQENQALIRTAQEKQALKDQEEERKMKLEHEALIERGKELLEKQFGDMVRQVEKRQRVLEWRKKRLALSDKRKKAILAETIEEGKTRPVRKLWPAPVSDTAPDIILPESSSEPMEIDQSPRPSIPYQPRIRLPPGGKSTVGSLLKDPVAPSPKPAVPSPAYTREGRLEALRICSDLLFDAVLTRVLRAITPRKKWAIAQQDHTLADLMTELGLTRQEETGTSRLPLPLIIDKSLLAPINLQCQTVDRLCVHLLLKKLALVDHLSAIRRYALMSAGDTMELFTTSLFSVDFTGDVQSAFEGAVKISSCKDDPFAAFCTIEDRRVSWFGITHNLRSFEDVEFLGFKYEAGWPLNIVINAAALNKYTTIFVTLLRLRYISRLLSDVKSRLHTSWQRRQTGPTAAQFRSAHFLRHKLNHMIMILQEYIVTEVHFSAWKQLEKSLARANTIDEIVEVHDAYLSQIMKRCFLEDKGRVVMDNVKIVFDLSSRFVTLLKSESPYAPMSSDTYDEMKRIEGDFDRVHRFMYNMTKTVASKGMYTELFLRLDFNRYLATVNK